MKCLSYSAVKLWMYKLTEQRKYCQMKTQDIENYGASILVLVRRSEVRWSKITGGHMQIICLKSSHQVIMELNYLCRPLCWGVYLLQCREEKPQMFPCLKWIFGSFLQVADRLEGRISGNYFLSSCEFKKHVKHLIKCNPLLYWHSFKIVWIVF